MSDSEYDRWEDRFKTEDYVFGTEPNAFLKSCAPLLHRGQKALSVADGEGRNGVWLAQQGLDVRAIDFSPSAIAKARKLAASRGVALKSERVDVTRWIWPKDVFDVVVAIFIQFTPPAERARVFAGMRHAVKPGGLLLMEGYTPRQLEYKTGGPSQVENLYTKELLEKEFAGWDILELREYDTEVSEGARHSGMSALIDLRARKPAADA